MTIYLFLLFLPISFAFLPEGCGIVPEKETRSRIARLIGGNEMNPPYPWIVRIDLLPHATPCTGSPITKRHVLTSAHCLFLDCSQPISLDNITVCHGTTEVFEKCGDPGKVHLVERAFNLANYLTNDCEESRDFAILELTTEIAAGVPVCLPLPENGQLKYPDDWDHVDLYVAGFGNNDDVDGDNEGHLICTSWRAEESAICEGDSGGPMTEMVDGRHVQIGINHMSNGGWCNLDKIIPDGNDAYQGAVEVSSILPIIQNYVNLE